MEFKNDLATTRGQSNAWQPWQSVLPINSELGSYEGSGMENIAYTITFQGGADKWQSKGASTWAAATLFNTLADAQTFSIARSLPIPARGINVWLFPTITAKGGISGSTPMLRRLASTSLASKFIDFLLVGTGLLHLELVKQIIQRQLPDMTIFCANGQGALRSDQLNPFLYHELGHTQHYNQVGNNFWTAYIAHIVQHIGYGEKSHSGSGRIAISEGWGNYTEQLFTIDKYRGTAYSFRADAALNYLEYQVPTDNNNVYNQG